MANLTDADKVLRNDTGKSIVSKLDGIKDAIVAQGGGAHSLDQLSDVEIDSQTLAAGQSIVYNDVTEKFENGEVSTVAALDDLTDVSISSPAAGDSLRNDGNGNWVNEPTKIVMTQAEWDAIADKQAWRNAHKNTDLILSDAPNLNATAQDISYDGSTDTVWDKVESKAAAKWTRLGNYSGSDSADISSIFATANELKITARNYTSGQLGSSQIYTVVIGTNEITDFLAGGFTELHYLEGMNNGQSNVIDFAINSTTIRIATFLLNGNDVKSNSNTGFKVYYR